MTCWGRPMKYNTTVDVLQIVGMALMIAACAQFLDEPDARLDNQDIAQAYADIDALVDSIAELSAPKTKSGHWPLINAVDKKRMGVDIRQAKSLVDSAHRQVKGGQPVSAEYEAARSIIDDLSAEVAPLMAERDF